MVQGELLEAEVMDQQEVKKAEGTKKELFVKINKSGVLDFANQVELANAAKLVIQMRLAPESLRKEGVEAVMSALTVCRQFKLPVSAMNEMAYIKGKISVYGSMMTALAQRHPEYGEFKVQYIDENQDIICLANKNLKNEVWAAVISVRKKGSEVWNEYFFSKDEAKAAGLLGSDTYKKYLKVMLYHRAKTLALRTEYPSALQGIESAENLMFEDMVERDVTGGSPDDMNKRLNLIKES